MTQQLTRPPTLPTAIVVAAPARDAAALFALSRRRVLKVGFWGAIFATLAGVGATIVNSLYPRSVEPFGGPVAVPAAKIPKPGEPPVANYDGHFLLVNLAQNEGRIATDDADTDGGLLALWWKCPHLGCTLPWKGDFVAKVDPLGRRGWFNCNCHGSTYTKAGVRVSGPAPRSMDTMQIAVGAKGDVTVQTGKRRSGGLDNPQRATPWSPPA